MQEVLSESEIDKKFEAFRNAMKRYLDYLHYLETQVRADKLTAREREILEKHGRRKKNGE